MHDDPFARAVERVEAEESRKLDAEKRRRQERLSGHARTSFEIHLAVFISVNVLLIAIWASVWQLADGTSFPWFAFVLLGWGVGLAAHWAAVRSHRARNSN